MAQLPNDLLQEVQAFLGGPLAEESSALSAACDEQRRCLLRKIVSIAVAVGPVYLDMNAVKSNNKKCGVLDTFATRRFDENGGDGENDVDVHQSNQNASFGTAAPSQVDTCTACSVCSGCDNLFPCDDSQREPSALEAKMSPDLLRSGIVWRLRSLPLPLLGRRRRRYWAALFPGRLLLFTSQRSSRPKTVLPLRVACSAAYSARVAADFALPNAVELYCPGRKTHQLLTSDGEDARAWLDAIRLAARVPSKSTKTTVRETNPRIEAAVVPSPPPTPPPTRLSTVAPTEISHCGADSTQQTESQQYEPMSADPGPAAPADEIYHDIAPPATPPPAAPSPTPNATPNPSQPPQPPEQPQPQYENGHVLRSSVDEDNDRPVYDDVGQLNLYKNVPSPTSKPERQEIVYDDVGIMNGIPTQGSAAGALYELIDDNSTPINNRLST